MHRFLTCVSFGVGCVLWCAGITIAAEANRRSETLLPDTTQGLFAISDADILDVQWNKTQLGHLMADPLMKPFVKDLRRQIDARWSNVHDRLGLTLEDMRGVPGGDSAIALIAPAPGKAALAIVIDVTGKLPQANAMLKKVTAAQLERGATQSVLKVDACPDPVIQFDLPELEEDKDVARSTLKGSEKSEAAKKAGTPARAEEKPVRQAFYCLTGNLLAVTDNLDVMKGILSRAGGHQNDSLADFKPFQDVIQRCRSDYGEGTPQIRWFIRPLGYAEAARAATPASRRRKGKSILEVMRNQGIGAIQGVGGFLDFATEDREMVHRTAVYAPPPYEKSMKMLVLPNESDFAPQPWVPRDIATYTTLYFDILNAFDNFGPLFDELMGEQGVWVEVLAGLADVTGPQVDLRKDLIQYLGQRVSMLTDYQLPITTSSERLLFAIEATNPKAVATAIEKLMKNDPTAKRRDVNGHVIWEVVEDESSTPEAPKISFGDEPVVAPTHSLRKKKKNEEDEEEENEAPPLLPHAAITVWEGHLVVASHIDFLLKVIAPKTKPEPLAGDAYYRLVDEEIQKLEPKERCLRVFSRTDEEYRPTYELVRQNKMPESETMLARMLNALFGEGKKGLRHQQIDGSQLPEYEAIRHYLGPAGFQVTSEGDGWYLKGFTLRNGKQVDKQDDKK